MLVIFIAYIKIDHCHFDEVNMILRKVSYKFRRKGGINKGGEKSRLYLSLLWSSSAMSS